MISTSFSLLFTCLNLYTLSTASLHLCMHSIFDVQSSPQSCLLLVDGVYHSFSSSFYVKHVFISLTLMSVRFWHSWHSVCVTRDHHEPCMPPASRQKNFTPNTSWTGAEYHQNRSGDPELTHLRRLQPALLLTIAFAKIHGFSHPFKCRFILILISKAQDASL